MRIQGRLILPFLIGLLGWLLLASCSARPSARYGAVMVYDSQGEQMIMFGGRQEGIFGERPLNDLWSLDPENLTWTRIETDHQPSPRLSPGMVYDPVDNRIILFGGLEVRDRMNDTWIFDLEQGEWNQIHPGSSPSPRSDVGFAIDPEGRSAVLFSGHCQGGNMLACDDTWIFDLDALSWTRQDLSGTPPIRYGHSFLYDPEKRQYLAWGGNRSENNRGRIEYLGYGDTFWSYSSIENAWRMVDPGPVDGPQARYWHHLVFIEDQQRLVLFSGDGGRGYLSDTWLFSLTDMAWQRVSANNGPPPRVNGAAAYDPGSKRFFLFGGLGENFTVFGDTWMFSADKNEWVEVE